MKDYCKCKPSLNKPICGYCGKQVIDVTDINDEWWSRKEAQKEVIDFLINRILGDDDDDEEETNKRRN